MAQVEFKSYRDQFQRSALTELNGIITFRLAGVAVSNLPLTRSLTESFCSPPKVDDSKVNP